MVVYVVGWHQRHHITAAQSTLVRQAQFGAAAGMADHVPPLVSLHTGGLQLIQLRHQAVHRVGKRGRTHHL